MEKPPTSKRKILKLVKRDNKPMTFRTRQAKAMKRLTQRICERALLISILFTEFRGFDFPFLHMKGIRH